MVAVTAPWLAVFTAALGLGRLFEGPAIERAVRQVLRMLGHPDDLGRMLSGVLGGVPARCELVVEVAAWAGSAAARRGAC